MTRHTNEFFRELDPEEAARLAVEAQAHLTTHYLGSEVTADGLVSTVMQSIERRKQAGHAVDPINRFEVRSLVNANLGNLDHLTGVRRDLIRFTVGYAQTDQATLDAVRAEANIELDRNSKET